MYRQGGENGIECVGLVGQGFEIWNDFAGYGEVAVERKLRIAV
jgi:hypothetical protein